MSQQRQNTGRRRWSVYVGRRRSQSQTNAGSGTFNSVPPVYSTCDSSSADCKTLKVCNFTCKFILALLIFATYSLTKNKDNNFF